MALGMRRTAIATLTAAAIAAMGMLAAGRMRQQFPLQHSVGAAIEAPQLQAQSVAVATTRVYPNTRMRLAPPEAGTAPRVTSEQALEAVRAGGHVPDPVKDPEVELVAYSNDSNGDLQPDGSVKLLYQNVLAWAVTYHDVPFPAGELRPGHTGPRWTVDNDFVVIVYAK
jgi:hypothetical protein